MNFARRSGNKLSTIHKNSKYLIASGTIALKERPEATFVHGKNKAFKDRQKRLLVGDEFLYVKVMAKILHE